VTSSPVKSSSRGRVVFRTGEVPGSNTGPYQATQTVPHGFIQFHQENARLET